MKKSDTKAIILAAGTGSRLAPLTLRVPKCLVKVAGKEILLYQLEALSNAGIKEIIAKVIDKSGKKVKVRYRNLKRKEEVLDVVANIKKASKALKWKPQVNFDDGLSYMLK